ALLGSLLEDHAIAALLAALAVRRARGGNQCVDAVRRRPNLGEPDRARDGRRRVADPVDAVGEALDGVLGPDDRVADRAALEQQREDLAAEAAAKIARLREIPQRIGDLHEDVLAA